MTSMGPAWAVLVVPPLVMLCTLALARVENRLVSQGRDSDRQNPLLRDTSARAARSPRPDRAPELPGVTAADG